MLYIYFFLKPQLNLDLFVYYIVIKQQFNKIKFLKIIFNTILDTPIIVQHKLQCFQTIFLPSYQKTTSTEVHLKSNINDEIIVVTYRGNFFSTI